MRYFFFLGGLFLSLNAWAQVPVSTSDEQPIILVNADFEDFARLGKAPSGWYNSGPASESPPDVHPVPGSEFGVAKTAYSGDTYLGMVVRENDTWESVAQRLASPLQGGNCYEFSVHLCRSPLYVSMGRSQDTQGKEVNYTTPAKLRIWGGNAYGQKGELLAESSLIINSRWLEYNFRFEPKRKYTYIMLEAYYKTPSLFPYNGNLLVDNAQPIIPVPCDDDEPEIPVVSDPPVDSKDPIADKVEEDKPKKNPVVQSPIAETKPKVKEAKLYGKKRSELRVGESLRIEKLYFDADSSAIKPESYETLNELFDFLAENEDVKVEIGGHTNSTPPKAYCDRLSTARAKSIAEFLKERGIREERLKYVGYGKDKPKMTNKTPEGRRRNQRVEVKILSIGNG